MRLIAHLTRKKRGMMVSFFVEPDPAKWRYLRIADYLPNRSEYVWYVGPAILRIRKWFPLLGDNP